MLMSRNQVQGFNIQDCSALWTINRHKNLMRMMMEPRGRGEDPADSMKPEQGNDHNDEFLNAGAQSKPETDRCMEALLQEEDGGPLRELH